MRPKLSWLLAVSLLLGSVVAWNGPPAVDVRAARAASAPLAAPNPSCYTWDFFNNSGSDATGLLIHLKGIQSLSDVYTGALNPFGAPDPSSGYDPVTLVYTLVFSNGTAFAGDLVQIGFCANSTTLRLDSAPPAVYWVVAGLPAASAPLFVGLATNWVNSNHLHVLLRNEQSTTLTAFSFTAALPPAALRLDDLNDAIVTTLPQVSDQLADPLALAGSSSAGFDIFFDSVGVVLSPRQPVVLEAVLATDIDPGDAIHLIAQLAPPTAPYYLPIIQR